MYQLKCSHDEWPENYVVRGLNKKMNYFINKHRIYDLEFNIPIQAAPNNSLLKKDKSRFNKQQKIFEDESRFLNIDN